MARHERVRLLRRRAWATAQHEDPQPYEPHEETLPKIWDSLFSPLLAAHLYLLFDGGLGGFDADGRDRPSGAAADRDSETLAQAGLVTQERDGAVTTQQRPVCRRVQTGRFMACFMAR